MENSNVSFVKCCVALLLIGRGVLHYTSPQPYPLLFGENEQLVLVFGSLLVVFGLLALLPNGLLRYGNWMYLFSIPTIILIIQSVASYVSAGFVPEQFVEHTLQMALPLILIYVCKSNGVTSISLYYLLAVLVGLTFIGHAFFALGVHYVPGHFIEMTSRSLGMNSESSIYFLYFVGWMDVIFAVLAFVPALRKFALGYLIIWGLLTSLARIYYVLGDGVTAEWLLVNLPNTIYRLPHGLIPILMLLLVWKKNSKTSQRLLPFA